MGFKQVSRPELTVYSSKVNKAVPFLLEYIFMTITILETQFGLCLFCHFMSNWQFPQLKQLPRLRYRFVRGVVIMLIT